MILITTKNCILNSLYRYITIGLFLIAAIHDVTTLPTNVLPTIASISNNHNKIEHQLTKRYAKRNTDANFFSKTDFQYGFLQEINNELKRSAPQSAIKLTPEVCKNCQKLAIERMLLKLNQHSLKPAYPCDDWEKDTRTCWLYRNIGETLTIVLEYSGEKNRKPQVQWVQELHNINPKESKKYVIKPDDPPWNIVVGSKGFEFRLSPITEMDMDFNAFTASISKEPAHSITFRIKVVPIDLGLTYPGEMLVLNMESFISLPFESMKYVWYMEKEESKTLPSNMKKSVVGSILTISELRKEQEGIVACAVYTNMGFMIAKKRFQIQKIAPNEVLMYPSHHPTKQPAKQITLKHEQVLYRKKRMVRQEEPTNIEEYAPGNSIQNHHNNEEYTRNDKPYIQRSNMNEKYRHQRDLWDESNDESDDDASKQKTDEDSEETTESNAESISTEGNTKLPPISNVEVEQGEYLTGANNPTGKHINPQSSSNSSNGKQSDYIVEIVRHPALQDNRPEDEISRLITKCIRSTQCSGHASCLRHENEKSGFCKCFPSYYGNGISCWEDTSLKKALLLSESRDIRK